ncbi:MAG: hypothetical protein Q7V57_11075 [Actinomycetota bacterium]|nr:hypothetical protein [Actinomycetota bacterium]
MKLYMHPARLRRLQSPPVYWITVGSLTLASRNQVRSSYRFDRKMGATAAQARQRVVFVFAIEWQQVAA